METQLIEDPSSPSASRQTGIVVCTHDRPRYLRRCLRSLRRSQLDDAAVVIVDDGSNDEGARRLIRAFDLPATPLLKLMKTGSTGFGVADSLRRGWDLLRERFDCSLLTNLDSDVVVRQHWLEQLRQLFLSERASYAAVIATGFNAHTHPILESTESHHRKGSIGGVNLFFDADVYERLIRPKLDSDPESGRSWDWCVVEDARTRDVPLLCTRPSVLQHIGRRGYFSSPVDGHDVALDYWGDAAWRVACARFFFRSTATIARQLDPSRASGNVDRDERAQSERADPPRPQ